MPYQPKRDIVIALAIVAFCFAVALWIPRSEPNPCSSGTVDQLFWICGK